MNVCVENKLQKICLLDFRFALIKNDNIRLFVFFLSSQEYNPHTMSEEEVKLLNIKKLRRNDTGDYLCRVLNEYGWADLIHHLIVLPGKEI